MDNEYSDLKKKNLATEIISSIIFMLSFQSIQMILFS